MRELSTDAAPAALGPYSQGIVDGDRVFVSGQGPIDPATGEVVDGDIAARTDRTLDNVAAVLATLDLGLDAVVKATVFMTDIADYEAINEVYAERMSAPFPARSAVGVADLPAGIDVEIEVIATRAR